MSLSEEKSVVAADGGAPEFKQESVVLEPVPPRKRSKVSRACDECRRKKIRCDATMGSSAPCSHCKRSNDQCTFTRVPLKRGPSRTTKSVDESQMRRQSMPQINTPPAFPQQQQQQQILLPPLGSIGQILPPPGMGSSGLLPKPRSNSLNSQQQQQQHQQQMFWKVPYDLPPFERRNSTDSMSSSISLPFSPQGLTTAKTGSSNGSSPVYRPISGYDSLGQSDSEDEFLKRQSFAKKEGTVSPALSVTSLSSLNQNINKGLQISPGTQMRSLSLLKAVEYNLDIYYTKFNQAFPVLPAQRSFVSTLLPTLMSTEDSIAIVELFNTSLRLLNTCDSPSFDFAELVAIFQRADRLYAFKSFIGANDSLKLVLTQSLVLLDYCIILSGNDYSIGFAITFAILNDWKFPNHLRRLADKPSDYTAHSLRAYVAFVILDTVYSLSFGNQRLTVGSNDAVSDKLLNRLFGAEDPVGFRTGLSLVLFTMGVEVQSSDHDIVAILKSRQDLFEFFLDQKQLSPGRLDDYDEYIFESELKFFKLSKKLSSIATALITAFVPPSGGESPKTSLQPKVTPFLLASLVTCAKTTQLMLKLIKSLVKLNAETNTNDLASRLPRIESDLSHVDTCFSTRAVYPLPAIPALLKHVQMSQRHFSFSNSPDASALSKFRTWSLDAVADIEHIMNNESMEGILHS